jgi:adenylosuccinate synthase
MPVTVVVGGQYGSEGKGKVAHFLAKQMGASIAIRVGGPNSGHTVIAESGAPLIFRQLPTAAILPDVLCVLPPGSYIYPSLLQEELSLAKLQADRLIIDPNAIIIDEIDLSKERASGLTDAIASTGSGTGAAVIKRIERKSGAFLAGNYPALRNFIHDSSDCIRECLDKQERVIVEGTQGFGLSLLHSPHYPYATSRDTTAAAFLAEAGLSPLDVDDIVMVIRAHPIRVGGASGPLPNEFDWATLTAEGNHKTPLIEFTSVTKVVRRVAQFDSSIVQLAMRRNKPTRLVLNHLDYVDAHALTGSRLSHRALRFLRGVESALNRPIDFVGLGADSLLDMKRSVRIGSI